jgi:hypothetical protein
VPPSIAAITHVSPLRYPHRDCVRSCTGLAARETIAKTVFRDSVARCISCIRKPLNHSRVPRTREGGLADRSGKRSTQREQTRAWPGSAMPEPHLDGVVQSRLNSWPYRHGRRRAACNIARKEACASIAEAACRPRSPACATARGACAI